MRKRLALAGMAALLLQAGVASAQVSVTATAGDPGPTAYTTLGAAFTAINAGTHQGAITISINGNTTEPAQASLNNSGAGSASYTSVMIQPTVPATITGNLVGAIVKLNGADNVTIDGRIAGAGRNLSVVNTSTSTATAAVWLASVVVGNGASNNVIRNLELACGADQQTSTNSTFGIIMSGTTISTTSNGEDNDNNQFIANRIVRARYGIVTRGNATNNNLGLVIIDNIIGPNGFGADQIGKAGIFLQADTGAVVSRNLIQFVGVLATNAAGGTDRFGIAIGNETWSVTESATLTSGDYVVTRNVIHDVVEEKTFSLVGIRVGTTRGGGVATNNLIANNLIYNLRANATSGDQIAGIGWANGHTDFVVFNTIVITGDMDPGAATPSTTNGNGIRISQPNGTNNANLTMRNNSIYLDASSGTAALHFYAITANTAAYLFGTGALNNNNYYINPANPQLRTGGLGVSTGNQQTTEFATLANWQTAFTVPQDANSIQADPLHFSPTSDPHIQQASPNVDAAVTIATVTDDVDGQARPNGANPDIGADEFYPAAGTLQFSSSSYTGNEVGGIATITVTRASGANGAVQVDYATVGGGTATGGAACGGGVDYLSTSGTLAWADLDLAPKTFDVTICPDGLFELTETANLALSNAVGATLGTPSTAVLSIGDSFSGSYDIGPGQTFTSLTNPGGIFEALNSGGIIGNLTINIVSDLAGETGAIALNEYTPGATVTIKPSGAPRTITGSNATNGIIRFNGADNVTMDGSLTGGTANGQVGGDPTLRNLTVQNTNPAATAGGVIAVHSGANGAQNNVLKNLNVVGQDPTQTLVGISIGGATPGSVGTDNDNNRVENCSFRKAFVGIYHVGNSAANPNIGSVLTMNDLSGTGANRLRRVGIFVFNDNGIQITLNSIGGIDTNESLDAIGIVLGIQSVSTTATTAGGVTNAQVLRNRINGVFASSTIGFSAVGIAVAGSPGGANVIANNMISGVIAPSTSPDIVAGIFVAGVTGASTQLVYNSIENTGDRGAVANQIGSFGVAITGTNPTVLLRDNVFLNSQTSSGGVNAKSFSIGMQSTTFTNLDSNFNDFFVSGPNGVLARTGDLGTGGTDIPTLAAWQAAVSDDANSLSADPLFVSTTDPHLQVASPVVGKGTPVAGFTNDFDNDLRDATGPDIGADEIAKADLSTAKVGDVDPVIAGTNLTYTITVANAGAASAANASMADTVPAGTTFVSLAAPGGWSCTTPPAGGTGTVSCTNPLFAPGNAVFTLTVQVDPAVPSGSVISNTATASSSTADPNAVNNSATANTNVATAADLSVVKADSPDPVTAGNDLTYTITATNAGPSNAAAVTLDDTLPPGTTFVSLSSPAGWSCTTPPVGGTGAVNCTNPSLAGGNSAFTLIVKVDASVPEGTILTNTATAASSTTDPNPGNESGTATTTVAALADLSVVKTDSPDPVTAGSDLTYTITATNAGPSNAAAVTLDDTLPSGTTFVSLASPAGWSCTTPPVGGTGAVNCTNPSLAGGDSVFTLVVKVGADVATGTVLSNTATAASSTADPNAANNSATATTSVATAADLSVVKSDSPDPVTGGSDLTYTITATNAGPSNAAGVTLDDTLPPGTTFVSLASPGGWSCSVPPVGGTGTVQCANPSLATGNSVFTLVVNVDVSVPGGSILTNTATAASSTADPNPGNESGTTTTTVAGLADLSVVKTDSPDPVTVGNDLTYTITATNAGPTNAAAVTLDDTLPPGTTFVSLAAPAGWSCTTPPVGGTGTVNCTNPSLATGDSVFTLVVKVDTGVPAGTILTNTATAASSTADPNPGNESGTTTTTVAGLADLSVVKTDSPDPVTVGSNLTYTITATNAGPSTAAAVTLDDTLPPGTTFVSLASPAGWSCTTPPVGGTGAVNCTNPAVGTGNSVFTLIVKVDTTVPAGTILTNTATAASSTADPNPGNESGTTTTTVAGLANVEVDMTVDNPNPGPGVNVTFTVSATNQGPSAATNLKVTDKLPRGLSFVSATPSQGTYDSATGLWDVGPIAIADGGSATLSLVASVTATDTIVNEATKTAQGEADPDPSDNMALVVLNGAPQADIQVNMTVDNATPGTGTNVTFTVTAANGGPAGATGVEITDQLPASLAFVSATPSQGTYVPGTGVWTVGSIADGAAATLQIVATVNAGGGISNIATKTAEVEDDFVTINDSASVTLNDATVADLAIGKTASQEPVPQGANFTYTIATVNLGPATANNVVVTDVLPAEVTLVSATPSQGSCAGTTTVSCGLGALSPGGSAQVLILVTKTVGGDVFNTADVAADEQDPNPANNSSSTSTTPVELLHLEVE